MADRAFYEAALRGLPRERTALLPGLHRLQHAEGFVSVDGMRALADHIRVPAVEVHAAASTYNELRFAPAPANLVRVCTGLACRLKGAEQLLAEARAQGASVEEVPCFFACGLAPVAERHGARAGGSATGTASVPASCDGACWEQLDRGADGSRPAWLAAQERRITARLGLIDPTSLADYRATGGYEGLQKALAMAPGAVVDLVEASGLLGRGGAYFPTARKWRTAIEAPGEVYIVVNLEEGEPGVFKDRHLCEGDPHAVVEGTLIAAHAVQAVAVYFYINGEADLSAERIELAIDQARGAGYVPDRLHVEVRRGAGGYVCGEESVILNSIEGQRAVPRPRPPLPAEAG